MPSHTKPRTILHIDLNSFFASCEQQDNPLLRGKPLGVVQDSGKRSVIIASSREAKEKGIGTGMPIWEAKKIYPDIVITPANFENYIYYSRAFRKVCQYYSDQVEVFSIDELFIDVTHTQHLFGGALKIVQAIKDRLRVQVGSWFTVSVGVAPNKMLSKLASGSKKPDGLVRVLPEERLAFLDQHPLWHICGIAHRIQRRLNRLGIYTTAQMRQAPVEALTREFGALGKIYSTWAHGKDYSPVLKTGKIAPEKSFGNQVNLADNLERQQDIFRVFLNLCWQVAARMREKSMGARTVSLWLRYKDYGHHQQFTPGSACATAYDLYRTTKTIYKRMGWDQPVRFVGISAGNLVPLDWIPLALFTTNAQRERAAGAWDRVAEKYGPFHLRPASLLRKGIKEAHLNGFTKRF